MLCKATGECMDHSHESSSPHPPPKDSGADHGVGHSSQHQEGDTTHHHSAAAEHQHHAAASGQVHHTAPAARHDTHGGHDKHAGHSVAMFRDKFWISLALTIPTLIWGHMLQSALGYTAPHFAGAMYIPAIFGTLVFAYGGLPFIHGAVRE